MNYFKKIRLVPAYGSLRQLYEGISLIFDGTKDIDVFSEEFRKDLEEFVFESRFINLIKWNVTMEDLKELDAEFDDNFDYRVYHMSKKEIKERPRYYPTPCNCESCQKRRS